MKVSIIITARNEEKYLPMLFEDILNQTYPLQNTEVVLMDSNSTDNTRKLMEEFKENNGNLSVQIVTNERQIQAAGFNEGVKHATGDVVLKIDAHSRIPEDFVQNFNLSLLYALHMFVEEIDRLLWTLMMIFQRLYIS